MGAPPPPSKALAATGVMAWMTWSKPLAKAGLARSAATAADVFPEAAMAAAGPKP